MEEETSKSHTDQASPREEEQCIAFPQAFLRNLNPSTTRTLEDGPRWQNEFDEFDNLMPSAIPRTLHPYPPEQSSQKTVPPSFPSQSHGGPATLSYGEHNSNYTLIPQ